MGRRGEPYDGPAAPDWGADELARAVQFVCAAVQGERNRALLLVRAACSALRVTWTRTRRCRSWLKPRSASAWMQTRSPRRSSLRVTRPPTTPSGPQPVPSDDVIRRVAGQASLTAPNVLGTLTDSGNAQRLVNRHGDCIRYVVEWKKENPWIIWDGARWRRDTTGQIVELMKDTAAAILDEARAHIADADTYKALTNWARQSLNQNRILPAIRLAQSIEGIPVSARDLDADAHLIAFTNGTVTLRTGELKPADQDDLITKSVGHAFDPAATSPTVDWFLEWITPRLARRRRAAAGDPGGAAPADGVHNGRDR